MPRKTATKIFPIARHLALVVVILGTFLFLFAKPGSFSSQTPNPPATAEIFKKSFSGKPKRLHGKIYAARVPQKRIWLETTFSFIHLAFRSQETAWQGSGGIYFFVSQQPKIFLLTAKPPGVSFISRIFPFTIQPNAP